MSTWASISLVGLMVGIVMPLLGAIYYAWRPWRAIRGRGALICIGGGGTALLYSLLFEPLNGPEVWTFSWINIPTLLSAQMAVDTSVRTRVLALFVLVIFVVGASLLDGSLFWRTP